MSTSTAEPTTAAALTADRLGPALAAVRRRLRLLKWLVPVAMFALVVVFEMAQALWLPEADGQLSHVLTDVALYGLLGPILAAVMLELLGRWIEERETSELQALALVRAREQAQASRQLTDDTLQTLFAASTLLSSLEEHAGALPPGTLERLLTTHQALDQAISRLHRRLT
jgi:hypothetical protein